MKWDVLIKGLTVAFALLTFILATVYVVDASPPMPVGVASYITVDGDPIEDGYLVTVKNENTGETVYDYTENGYIVAGLSGIDGDEITVSIEYDNKLYTNSTIVDTSRATQWVNISITTSGGDEGEENKKPVIIIPDVFEGNVGQEIIFDASQCYDPDGYIVKYEWTFYDYPPFTLYGKVVRTVFDNVCNIMGVLTVYDNDYATSSKTFNIIISEENYNNDNNTNNTNSSSDNETIITFPPMPPIANFTLSDSFYDNNTLYVNFTSTSYDNDGYIVNWTWTIEGKLYYGENITVEVPIVGENESFVKLNVTLLVTDNDGLYDEISAVVTLNTSYISEEKYHLVIYSPEPVTITLKSRGEIIDSNYGTQFDYYLPLGNYEVLYAYNGENYNKTINLNKNTEIILDIPVNKNSTPAFELLSLLIAFGVIIYVRKKM